MYFSPLRSLDLRTNPGAARWADVRLSTQELDAFLRRMVMVIGWDDTTGTPCVLGSGFLVGTEPDLIAITASHVLTEWADHVRPPRRHAFSGLHGDDEDLRNRLNELVQRNLIRAAVRCPTPGLYAICQVNSLTFTANPRQIDVASLTLRGAAEASLGGFSAFPVDVDPGRWQGPVLMAGFVKGSSWEPRADGAQIFRVQQNLAVRVGYCRGRVSEPRGFGCPMYQLNIPSDPGMSGGPVLALRTQTGDLPRIISSHVQIHPTSIGVISRDCIAPTVLLDGSDSGETWATPIEDAYLLRLGWRDRSVYFGELVCDGRIKSYGRRALTAEVFDEPEGRIGLRFGTSDESGPPTA
jgi:hypothetical protein